MKKIKILTGLIGLFMAFGLCACSADAEKQPQNQSRAVVPTHFQTAVGRLHPVRAALSSVRNAVIRFFEKINSKKFSRTVVLLGLCSAFLGLFACNKAPKPAQHDLSEITSVSISCGHMDRRYGYSFWIHRNEDIWLFDAECFTHDREVETVFENREVSGEAIDALFEILDRNNLIVYAENYKMPIKLPFQVMDDTTYSFCLTFSDGNQYLTCDVQKELEDFFYLLAEK